MLSYRVSARVFEHSHSLLTSKRCYSEIRSCNLVGRDFVNPGDYSCSELKSLLWTALDLKEKFKERKRAPLDVLKNCNATLLSTIPNVKYQVAIANAVRLLGADIHVVIEKRWETSTNVCDLGRYLSGMTDIVLARSETCEHMNLLRDGASVPVISIACGAFKPLQGLANLLTIYEHFCRLKGLRLGWVGPPEEMFNTHLIMCPRVGMHIQFTCSCEPDIPRTPLMFNAAVQNCMLHNTEIAQHITPEDAVYRVDVITTTLHNKSNMHITKKMTKEAALDWIFLHDLPRTKNEVADDVFYSKNSKVWEASKNFMWVTMAVILQVLKEYHPIIQAPTFDGRDTYK